MRKKKPFPEKLSKALAKFIRDYANYQRYSENNPAVQKLIREYNLWDRKYPQKTNFLLSHDFVRTIEGGMWICKYCWFSDEFIESTSLRKIRKAYNYYKEINKEN